MIRNGKPPLRVLLIEDSQDDVELIVRTLRNEWHVVWHRVENEAGLLLSLEEAWNIILCDVSLPQFNAERALIVTREYFILKNATLPPFIVLSGTVDETEGIKLFQKGARDFLPKSSLLDVPQRLLMSVKRELRQNGELLAKEIEITEAYDAVIAGWGKALELRDVHTAGHTERVTACSLRLAIALNVNRNEFVDLNRGALLHDIGKMGIPDEILFKRDYLTDDEWKIMRMHPVYAYDMLKNIPFLKNAAVVPLYHHERWNGSGYPQGKMGTEIPFLARLFAVCDVYDALTSDRPYRKSWDKSQAIAYLIDESGKTFDPDIIKEFVDMTGRG
jgi:HD-GYP domain-containing protein (c-di-GMP phosphodiesterase class II)